MTVHLSEPIGRLEARFPAFAPLASMRVKAQKAHEWVWEGGAIHHRSLVVFFGKTGYGKSTTINRLIGADLFASSPYDSCTRTCQAADYVLGADNYLSIVDLPGIAEHVAVDQDYLATYDEYLRHAQVVVYLLRADQRDLTVDERFLRHVRARSGPTPAIVFGVNCCDKLPPLLRDHPFRPTAEHERLIAEKRAWAARTLAIDPGSIVMYSADGAWELDELADAIATRLVASGALEPAIRR